MASDAFAQVIFKPIVTDWLIPILLLGIASLGKKVSRTTSGWLAEDFYLGSDLCLAAVSTGLLKIFDLLRQLPTPQGDLSAFAYDVALCALLLVFSFGSFIYVLLEERECLPTNSGERFRRI